MQTLLIKNARLVNEGEIRDADVLLDGDRIARIDASISVGDGVTVIDAAGKYLIPGMIDDQVHFREPGLTHKGDLATESAVWRSLLGEEQLQMADAAPPPRTVF